MSGFPGDTGTELYTNQFNFNRLKDKVGRLTLSTANRSSCRVLDSLASCAERRHHTVQPPSKHYTLLTIPNHLHEERRHKFHVAELLRTGIPR